MDRVQMSFSPEVKRAIVEELESGQLSLREAAARGHTTVSRIQLWLKEYGRYQPKRDIVEVVMKSEEEKIAALERALADAHLKLLVHEKIIEVASKKYKVDLKKLLGRRRRAVSRRNPRQPRTALPSGRALPGCVLQASSATQGREQRGGIDLATSR